MRVIEIKEGIPFNIAMSDILIPLIGLLMILGMILYQSLDAAKYAWLFVGLLLWLILTSYLAIKDESLITANWLTVYGEWIKTLISIVYFYIGYQVLKYINLKTFFRVMSVGYAIFLSLGFIILYVMKYGPKVTWLLPKQGQYFMGTYTDPNHAATWIVLSLFILLTAYQVEGNRWFRGFYVILIAMSFVGIAFTDSRGGILALGVSLLIYIIIMNYNRISSLLTVILSGIWLVMLTLWVDSHFYGGTYIGKLFGSFKHFDKGLDVREGLATTALAMGKDHWLFGVGRGNYILNAPKYFEQLGLPYIENIPHNTFIGLFAEVGVVGLLLYLTPVFLISYHIIKKATSGQGWLKSHKRLLVTMMCGVIGLVVQASVLNVENQRPLWFLSGVLLYGLIYELLPQDSIQPELSVIHRKRHSWMNIGLALLTLMMFLTVATYVHMPQGTYYETGNFEMKLPIPDELVGESITLDFYLYAHQSGLEEQETVLIEVIEDNMDGTSQVSQGYLYPRTNGNLTMDFIKQNIDSTIHLVITKKSQELYQYRFLPKRMYTKDRVLELDRFYYLIRPKKLEEVMLANWTDYDESRYEHLTFKPLINDFKPVVFEHKIKLIGVNVIDNSNDNNTVELVYECLEDINQDYVLWLYGVPDNLNNLDPSRLLANNEYYSPLEPVATSTWRGGETHRVRYEFPRDYGWYNLRIGMYYKQGDEVIRLVTEDGVTNNVILGWLDARVFKNK
jgi:O-antigen ligase